MAFYHHLLVYIAEVKKFVVSWRRFCYLSSFRWCCILVVLLHLLSVLWNLYCGYMCK